MASIASPMPVRLNSGQLNGSDHPSTDIGRETPLPQYERMQSVPFTLNLQEDPRQPGQFQLVVNINPGQHSSTGIPLSLPTPNGSFAATDAVKPNLDSSKLYQTQKSSPPTTPLQDKQGWSDLDAVPPQFLNKVVPDWNVTFSRSDSTASTQSKRLSDIRARIKKKGKGYVVRLLKGSTSDANEIAEVDLGQQTSGADTNLSHELDTCSQPTELDSIQATIVTESSNNNNSIPADVYEIGTSNEPGVQRLFSNLNSSPPSLQTAIPRPAVSDGCAIRSIAEENLSDAETLIPDVHSIRNRMYEEQPDADPPSATRFSHPARSASISSIVKTPTRGLSVVGPVRRAGKVNCTRSKNKTVQLEVKRSDAHKSVKRRSPRGSTSSFTTEASVADVDGDATVLRERAVSFSRDSFDQDSPLLERSGPRYSSRDKKPVKLRNTRRLSADDSQIDFGQKSKLRLQTNVPQSKSINVSPVARRKSSLKKRQPFSSSSSSINSANSTDRQSSSPEWSEVDPSKELREALGRAFRAMADSDEDLEDSYDEQVLPRIIETKKEGEVGEIPLPPEVEIGSFPIGVRSSAAGFWGLAITALAKKVSEGFDILRDAYSAEPPVQPGHVRVRWTCSCGESLYDDFIEKRPNAARLLEAYLNRPRTHAPRSPTSQSSTASSVTSLFDASSRASTLATPSSTYDGALSWTKKRESSQYSPTRLRTNSSFSVRMPSFMEESWLLTCANEGKLTPKIVHLDVNQGKIKSDKDLALALRQHHDQLNRRWFNWARLRGLTTIEFVQFEVHRNRFADIRATPSMPPRSATSPVADADAEASKSLSQHPYTFEPVELLPPVGSTYLLHLFKHPNDYDGELITYLRSPKRRSRLEFGMGWGIHLVEGFIGQKVWAVAIAICTLASVAFAVMWTILRHDVQGAFGVAQWVLGLSMLFVGGLQTWLE